MTPTKDARVEQRHRDAFLAWLLEEKTYDEGVRDGMLLAAGMLNTKADGLRPDRANQTEYDKACDYAANHMSDMAAAIRAAAGMYRETA